MLHKIQLYWHTFVSNLKSKNTYPEDIDIDLLSLISNRPQIKVAIIDDKDFPFKIGLEEIGCKVTCFEDYSKKISQRNEKIKVINFTNFDIIICDIHGVGTQIYPGSEGLSIIEDLRKKHPLKVIAAYTGNPGIIVTKLKNQFVLDKVFSKDWQVEDFLFNFKELINIFEKPKHRWDFIQRRLQYLEVNQHKIAKFQKAFVSNILLCKALSNKPDFNENQFKTILDESSSKFDLGSTATIVLKATELGQLILPFLGSPK
jgi:hypothetical protein